jgi:hypothetical protein
MKAPLSRSDRVHQAVGMISVQAECSIDDALERLEKAAQMMSQTLEQIAVAVIERRMRFGARTD